MTTQKTVSQQLQTLLTDYSFNPKALSRYLGITEESVTQFADGDLSCLPDDTNIRFRIFSKVLYLIHSAEDDKTQRIRDCIVILMTKHQIAPETIAKMSGVPLSDIDHLLSEPMEPISTESLLNLSVTALSLRYSLKEWEDLPPGV